jgi:hypothetical protein
MASSHHVDRMSGCFPTFWDRPTHAKLTPLDIALPHRYVGHPPLGDIVERRIPTRMRRQGTGTLAAKRSIQGATARRAANTARMKNRATGNMNRKFS